MSDIDTNNKIDFKNPLSKAESQELIDSENIIIKLGSQSCYDKGKACCKIKNGKLYRGVSKSFGSYSIKKLGMTSAHANRLILFAKVIDILKPIGSIVMPLNESQVRDLSKLVSNEDKIKVWKEAIRRSEGNAPTGKLVREIVEEELISQGAEISSNKKKKSLSLRNELDGFAEKVTEFKRDNQNKILTDIEIKRVEKLISLLLSLKIENSDEDSFRKVA